MSIRVTVWNENRVKESTKKMYEIYPGGIHGILGEVFQKAGFLVKTALLDESDNGLPEEVLNETDVLVYWSHIAQDEVSKSTVQRIVNRVNQGMGFIPLHSAHMCKPFVHLMGTTCTLRWREAEERELLWGVCPGHPILNGISECIDLKSEETYGEYFDIPKPDETVFISWFEGGEVFRSGVCYHRGKGRIFYFQPGHETYPTYKNKEIQKILINAVKWAAPYQIDETIRNCRHVLPAVTESRTICAENLRKR